MLVLGKKIDYALISLSWLNSHQGEWVSAREIAEANGLPLPALMQILKVMHQNGVLRSTRGVKGGYQIAVSLDSLSLHSLSQMLSQADDRDCMEESGSAGRWLPVEAMRKRLSQFLRDVSVSEVVRSGRSRIDVPLQNLRIVERVIV